MTPSWPSKALSECAKFLSGGTPNKARSEFWIGDIPWVSSGEMAVDRIDDTELHISEAGLEAGSRLVPAKTILTVVRGMSLAKEFRVAITTRPVAFNQDIKALIPNADMEPRFLYYALCAQRDWIRDRATEASHGTKKLSTDVLGAVHIPQPSMRVQERIAEVMWAYDDLIENNRRRMALLEDAARQLYREWFVRLRFPGREHTNIVGGVPTGWQLRTFADACSSLEDGDWIESKDQGGEDYRLLQISNIGINEFVETGNFRYVTEQTFKRLNCRELLPGHLLIARMPKPIGRAWLVTEMPWRMITAVDGAIAVADDRVADAYFLTYFLNSPGTLDHSERRAVGATRARIARRELANLPLLLPPLRLQAQFREVVEPLNQQRAVLHRQNDKLRAARDLLLPRLMSGAIPV